MALTVINQLNFYCFIYNRRLLRINGILLRNQTFHHSTIVIYLLLLHGI